MILNQSVLKIGIVRGNCQKKRLRDRWFPGVVLLLLRRLPHNSLFGCHRVPVLSRHRNIYSMCVARTDKLSGNHIFSFINVLETAKCTYPRWMPANYYRKYHRRRLVSHVLVYELWNKPMSTEIVRETKYRPEVSQVKFYLHIILSFLLKYKYVYIAIFACVYKVTLTRLHCFGLTASTAIS